MFFFSSLTSVILCLEFYNQPLIGIHSIPSLSFYSLCVKEIVVFHLMWITWHYLISAPTHSQWPLLQWMYPLNRVSTLHARLLILMESGRLRAALPLTVCICLTKVIAETPAPLPTRHLARVLQVPTGRDLAWARVGGTHTGLYSKSPELVLFKSPILMKSMITLLSHHSASLCCLHLYSFWMYAAGSVTSFLMSETIGGTLSLCLPCTLSLRHTAV